ncbi:MAG TPA: branched-chain amino acid ABC transporter permease [bacterium]|nr:branched-chain amino acid ABC transporter permease [bacterium]
MLSRAIIAAVFACELALVALSFNLGYRVIGFANFAHVEFVTVGAFIALTAADYLPLPAAALTGAVVAGLLAVVLNVSIFQKLREASVGTKMIASAGVAVGLRGVVQFVWGVDPRRFAQPTRLFAIDGAQMSLIQSVVIVTAIVSVVVFSLLLKFTRIGRNVRAVADNLTLAEARGVPTGQVLNQVWFISGAMAGLAGVLVGLDTFVRPELGISLLVPMFAAAIVGGAGSPFGAILGAALVSTASTAVVSIDFGEIFGGNSFYLGSEYKSIVAFSVLIMILAIRPSGFFGEQRGRA